MQDLQALGAQAVEGLTLAPYASFDEDSYDVLLYEFRRDLNRYLNGLPNDLHKLNLAKIIEFNEAHAGQELQFFDQSFFVKAQNLKLTTAEYNSKFKAVKSATRENGLDYLFSHHHLDVLSGITQGPAWLIDTINGDAFFGPGLSTYPAIAGNPHITVPVGAIGGMPVGLSFISKRNHDAELAEIAHLFQITRAK